MMPGIFERSKELMVSVRTSCSFRVKGLTSSVAISSTSVSTFFLGTGFFLSVEELRGGGIYDSTGAGMGAAYICIGSATDVDRSTISSTSSDDMLATVVNVLTT
jgi:hypothetical protein